MKLVKSLWKGCKSLFKLTLGVVLLIGIPMLLVLHIALGADLKVGGRE